MEIKFTKPSEESTVDFVKVPLEQARAIRDLVGGTSRRDREGALARHGREWSFAQDSDLRAFWNQLEDFFDEEDLHD